MIHYGSSASFRRHRHETKTSSTPHNSTVVWKLPRLREISFSLAVNRGDARLRLPVGGPFRAAGGRTSFTPNLLSNVFSPPKFQHLIVGERTIIDHTGTLAIDSLRTLCRMACLVEAEQRLSVSIFKFFVGHAGVLPFGARDYWRMIGTQRQLGKVLWRT